MISLLDLPVEIVLLIIDSLLSQFAATEPGNVDASTATQKDLNALLQTNTWLYDQLETRLYKFNAQHCGQTSLAFGAFHGYDAVVQKSLAVDSSNIRRDLRFPTHRCQIFHSPLCWAVQGGNISMVNTLLQSGADLHGECVHHCCDAQLLGQAAKNGHLDMMKDLVGRGLRPKIMWETTFVNPMNESAHKATLRLAAEGGHIACVDYTLATGEYGNLTCKQYMHKIALIVPATVANGHIECALYLLSRSGILERTGFCNCAGKPARSLVSDLPKLATVLEDPYNLEKYGPMLLYLAVATGCPPLFEEMVRLGVHIDTRFCGGNTALSIAIIEARAHDEVKKLLALGAGVNVGNSQDQTPLYVATMFRLKGMMKILLDQGADIEARGTRSGMVQTPLCVAVADFGVPVPDQVYPRRAAPSPSNEIVTLLLKNGANPNYADPKYGITPLWLAVRGHSTLKPSGRDDIVRLLLRSGADPNLALRNQSILFWAISHCHYDTIKMLLDCGANPNDYGANFDGSKTHHWGNPLSPLAKAMKLKKYGIAELLLDHGADALVSHWKKEISLFHATRSMNCSFIGKMIAAGLDVNVSVRGYKPLHMAIWQRNVEAAELLLRGGADPNLTVGGPSCISSKSMLWWAFSDHPRGTMVELLCAYGAKELYDTNVYTDGRTPRFVPPVSGYL
jgi:ankyrin repeat protein